MACGKMREGLARTDICLPYIFINPKQFAEGEDLDSYPLTLDADLEKIKGLGIDTVYMPDAAEIYPKNFQTTVSVADIAKPLEGAHRPHFFDGVTTIVCKMLLQCLPEITLLGEKDFQQLMVIKQMVSDLNIPVEIMGGATVRDENGLALSSRNAYLSEDEYQIACQLNKVLTKIASGEMNEKSGKQHLILSGFTKIDYLECVNAQSFDKTAPLNRVMAAAWIGGTRLIDNMPIAV